MIHNYQGLFEEVTSRPADGRAWAECVSAISHTLYKHTSCGICFHAVNDCENRVVSVAGYCEGVDIDCDSHELKFPFSADEFWKAVDNADNDGINLWNDTHGCEHCYDGLEGEYGYTPIQPNCNHCYGEGVIL